MVAARRRARDTSDRAPPRRRDSGAHMSITRLRQSQVVSTYGPGALVDLPDYAIIVAGLEHWRGDTQLISEPRLLANLRRRLNPPPLDLRPPPIPDSDGQLDVGIV